MLVAKSSAISRVVASPIAKSAPAAPIVKFMRPKDCTLKQTEGSRNNSIALVRCPANSGTGPDHTTPCKTTTQNTRTQTHPHTPYCTAPHHIRPRQTTLRKTPQRITINATQHDTTQCKPRQDNTAQAVRTTQPHKLSHLVSFWNRARLQARFALSRMLCKVPA